MSKSITDILAAIKLAKPLAQKDLNEVDFRTRPGWEAAKNQAQQTIEILKQEFRVAVHEGAVGIFLTGDDTKTKAFADIALKLGNAIHVRADELYHNIALSIESMMGSNRTLTVGQSARLLQEISLVAQALDIISLPSPSASVMQNTHLEDFAAVVDWVRNAIRQSSGDDLNAMYLERLVVNEALNREYDQNVIPVIISGATLSELVGSEGAIGAPLKDMLFSKGNLVVQVEGEVTEELVVDAFTKIRAKFTAHQNPKAKKPKGKKDPEDSNPTDTTQS